MVYRNQVFTQLYSYYCINYFKKCIFWRYEFSFDILIFIYFVSYFSILHICNNTRKLNFIMPSIVYRQRYMNIFKER